MKPTKYANKTFSTVLDTFQPIGSIIKKVVGAS